MPTFRQEADLKKINARLISSVNNILNNLEDYKAQIEKYKSLKQSGHKAKIAIFTAITNKYDSIKLPALINPDYDYILFTDSATTDTGVWKILPVTFFHEDSTRTARYIKTHPHVLLPDYDYALWIDSNIMIIDNIQELIEKFEKSGLPVAAHPHPSRSSIYEEVNECSRLKKDDMEIMEIQTKLYQEENFSHDDLIESNVMIFNMKHPQTKIFLDNWWKEIDKHSKRDQLSLNYAMHQTGIKWHRLTEKPESARNFAAYAYSVHDNNEGPAKLLLDSIGRSTINPYKGELFSSVRNQRIAQQIGKKIDIVLCVHNAPEEVTNCLDSIAKTRINPNQNLIIIDDGSKNTTTAILKHFVSQHEWAKLERNEIAQGYTKAANKGISLSTGELVILLNSDTIVTDGWAEKMADALVTTPGTGLVGPMSNAASHQSIPDHESKNNQTAINTLPDQLTPEDMNRFCEQWTSANIFPRVPLVHGFCFGITRQLIDTIGLLDEESFPKGYGEENDYCFRASNAGFGLVIATNTFVFHVKSKSYSDEIRVPLMKESSKKLRQLHTDHRVNRAINTMKKNPILAKLRSNAALLTELTPYRGH